MSVRKNGDTLAVPLSQLDKRAMKLMKIHVKAVNDWLYWVAQGREF